MKRISGLIYEETRGVLKIFLENVRVVFTVHTVWILIHLHRSFVILLHTPSTQSARLLLHLTWSTPSSVPAALSMVSVLKLFQQCCVRLVMLSLLILYSCIEGSFSL